MLSGEEPGLVEHIINGRVQFKANEAPRIH
jgi:hypothetical protein